MKKILIAGALVAITFAVLSLWQPKIHQPWERAFHAKPVVSVAGNIVYLETN